MTRSIAITVGCLALAVATIWIGSYCLPNRKKSKHPTTVKEPIQPNPKPAHHPNPFHNPNNPLRTYPDIRPFPNPPPPRYHEREPVHRLVPNPWELTPSRLGQTQRNIARPLLERWRASISGLMTLSERNIRNAKDLHKIGDETTATQHAHTAVENMARALIHCCGGKPDLDPGQEEVLKMLSFRFKAETKAAYDNAIDQIHYLRINKKAEQTLQIAEEITVTFKKVILSNYGEELQWRSPTTPQY